MKMWFPVFGSAELIYICKKWCILANDKNEAFQKAEVFWKSLDAEPTSVSYFYPSSNWVGPLCDVVENPETKGVYII